MSLEYLNKEPKGCPQVYGLQREFQRIGYDLMIALTALFEEENSSAENRMHELVGDIEEVKNDFEAITANLNDDNMVDKLANTLESLIIYFNTLQKSLQAKKDQRE